MQCWSWSGSHTLCWYIWPDSGYHVCSTDLQGICVPDAVHQEWRLLCSVLIFRQRSGSILWLMISIGCFAGRPAALRNERVLQGLVYVNIAAYLIFAVLRNLWYAGMQSRGSSVGYGSCADMPDISEQLHVCGMYLLWIADWLLFSINIKWPYKHICRGRYGKEYFNG